MMFYIFLAVFAIFIVSLIIWNLAGTLGKTASAGLTKAEPASNWNRGLAVGLTVAVLLGLLVGAVIFDILPGTA
ncbi:MAG: hypothetical protein RLY93_17175 [Sumerlaeia bacterium]